MRHLRLAGTIALLGPGIAASALHGQIPSGATTIHGFVREAETGEPVPFSRVVVGTHGRQSDRGGYFSFVGLEPGEHPLRVRGIGYAPVDTVVSTAAAPLEIRLEVAPLELTGVTVAATAPAERPFRVPEVSVRTVTPAQVRQVPAALERDLFRAVQALPGVVAPSAFSSRLLVRGGAADQNQFLLDGYPVIHPYHLTGAFSAFHLDAVQDAEFWLGAPPARYGGRLSSVLDVGLREGNRETTTGAASLGLVTSAAVVEGPHARGAWFAGLRATYLDLLTKAIGTEVPYRFYDAYAKAYADLTPSDRVSGLVFIGRDATWRAWNRGDHFNWANDVVGVSWRHLFGGRAVFEQRLSVSRFTEKLDSGYSALQSSSVVTDHAILLIAARGEVRIGASDRHEVEMGYAAERRAGDYGIRYIDPYSRELQHERAARVASTTLALYAQDDFTWTEDFRVRLGVRAESNQGHTSLQPRLSAKYLISDRTSLSAGMGLLRQYDQQQLDPDVDFDIYTADLWFSSRETGIPVARAAHYVLGMETELPQDLRLRVEAYEKRSDGLITIAPFDPEVRRFSTERLETATGVDRGVDLSITRRANGPIRGWIGYSLASSRRTVSGDRFPAAPYPRQRFVAVGEVDGGRKWAFTGRFEAFEGIPFTPAVAMVPERRFDFSLGRFTEQCHAIDIEFLYGPRNSARTGWSKRLDLGAARSWTDGRGWKWELSLSLLNALLDPVGVFRPGTGRSGSGCDQPADVVKEHELVLPPIPSIGLRVVF